MSVIFIKNDALNITNQKYMYNKKLIIYSS